ncbi:MAG: hypothetical protein QOI54_1002 [Actinomycetota bacterium]|jgi:hypothetical protein|nr:hypothetical protein [Actinomycetota bacterium]
MCDSHGAVQPLQPAAQPSLDAVHYAVSSAAVPVWLPWPLPKGWLVTGLVHAGDERTPGRAVAMACSGPAPLGGPSDAVIVAEEPGIGLGARYAGLDRLDGGPVPDQRPPDAKVQAAGHPTALWSLPGAADRAVYVGEALGCWLWLVIWPETAGFLLVDEFGLTDLRDVGHDLDIPFGALSPRLAH